MTAHLSAPNGAPVSTIDPFSTEFLEDPYPFHEELRQAGPVVFLERYGVWTMARHAEVASSLADWQIFSSARGVGIDDFRKVKPRRPASILLEADPPLHTRTHGVLAKVMSLAAVRRLREEYTDYAGRLVDELVERREFDGVTDLAEVFPLRVFPDAVGLGEEGRHHLLAFSNAIFNSFGPENELFRQSMVEIQPVIDWVLSQCRPEALAPGRFGAQVYEALDAGEIAPEEAPVLVRSMLTAGLDTTVNGIGNTLYGFVQSPGEWQFLRQDRGLVRPAFDESLRWESPVQSFFRTTTRPVAIDGVTLDEGEKVMLFLAAANRDPRKWPEPERFDVRRRPAGHVALGRGIHACVGQLIARVELELVFDALAERVETIELAGPPVRRLNNTVRGLSSLPLRVTPAAGGHRR